MAIYFYHKAKGPRIIDSFVWILTHRPQEEHTWISQMSFWKYFFQRNIFNFYSRYADKNSINNVSALIQVMAWHQIGAKPLPEPMLTKFYNVK